MLKYTCQYILHFNYYVCIIYFVNKYVTCNLTQCTQGKRKTWTNVVVILKITTCVLGTVFELFKLIINCAFLMHILRLEPSKRQNMSKNVHVRKRRVSELSLKNCNFFFKFMVIDGVLYNDKYLTLHRIKNPESIITGIRNINLQWCDIFRTCMCNVDEL